MNTRVHQNHFARKRFGQNFLKDTAVIDSIVAAIQPKNGETIVEIGPGLAALTLPVARQIEHLTVVEIDRDLAYRLSVHPELAPKLTIIGQDALTLDFTALSAQHKQPLRVFGNLPYNISTPLIFHLFDHIGAIKDMHFMLQREVVNRLAAGPNSKTYGKLTVMAQYYCQIIPVLEVPPDAFVPAPKVDSAVVRLAPYATPPYSVSDVKMLHQITAAAFNQRRKTIRNSLSAFFTVEQLTDLGIDPGLRAENLSVADYCTLTQAALAAQ